MKLPSEAQLRQFDKWNVPRPSHSEHGITDSPQSPLSDKLVQAKMRNFRMEGNMLYCDTDFGPLCQNIPTSHILIGEENGLPVFKEIVV